MTQVLARSSHAIRHGDATVDWQAHRPARQTDDPSGPTLASVIDRAWEVLGAELPAGCPVCGGELTPRPPAVGGRCESCGSTLS
jgi:hypothetical protein